MKNKKSFYGLCIFILSIFILFSCNTRTESVDYECYEERLSLNMSFINNEICISNHLMYCVNGADKQMFYLFDSICEPTLFLSFSSSSCNLCTESVIDLIELIFPDYENNSKIVFFGRNINNRKKNSFRNKNVLSNDIESLGIPFEEYDDPFFFILDYSMKVKMFYIPSKFDHEMTKSYLTLIRNRYSL